MPDDGTHLRTVLRAGGAATADPAAGDDDSGLPSLREGEYQAYARAANKPVHAIHFVDAKGHVRSFQYAHLDSDSRFSGERITLRFLGMEATRVEIEGRNLWRLYDYVHQHRMCWVMTAPRDFAKDGQSIVTAVSFAVIEDVE